MMKDFDSCPVCGGAYYFELNSKKAYVYCLICKIEMKLPDELYDKITTLGHAVQMLSELWNKRPIQNKLTSEVARLKSMNRNLNKKLKNMTASRDINKSRYELVYKKLIEEQKALMAIQQMVVNAIENKYLDARWVDWDIDRIKERQDGD